MKKIFVVSKTHLDLGFTDYAENIRRKYIDNFIPQAIALANEVNTYSDKNFIWTTGSWIIKEALEHSNPEQKSLLIKALKDENIVPHALPFTTHSELFDKDTFDYGLSIVDEIDEIRGKKTISAKMTDVPGHTKAIVPLLAKHGIKLLHIGVNGVSAVPDVPECFLWKCDDAEVIVIYSGDYGGAFKSAFTDEILYFDHTLDNKGAPSPKKVLSKLSKIKDKFPDYEVSAGTLDEYAQIMWKVKDRLPVLHGEIGDSWIHGSASDPYKYASLRELMGLKKQWLNDGSMKRMSDEYKAFSDKLLCIGEHTCGMDGKTHFADYENYLKSDFQKARQKDKVVIKHLFRDFPHNFYNANVKLASGKKKHSYSVIEKSWAEQRLYIDNAVNHLSDTHKSQALASLAKLRPGKIADVSSYPKYDKSVSFSDFCLELNEFGGIGSFTYNGNEILKNNNKAFIEYRSYTSKDYDFWFSHYARNMDKNAIWGYPDFGKPLLKYADGKYPSGSFFYKMTDARVIESKEETKVVANLQCESSLCEKCGAPREVQVQYTLNGNGLKFDVLWCNKDANRLTEAIFLHLYPKNELTLVKMGSKIDYKSTVSMGGRNLHAVEKCEMNNEAEEFVFYNCHSPLISIGKGKILEYDNRIESAEKDGVSYVLYNNVWGTNFPFWYEDNALFSFEILRKEISQ